MEELPECPVCLQSYNDRDTVPRVLSCGHSVCEACLLELPRRYPDTIRCPACTQLVKYPTQQGPSALPKNIDLLRLCLEHPSYSSSENSRKSKNDYTKSSIDHSQSQFCPRFWSDELYDTWKDWVLPHDVVFTESEPSADGISGLCFVLRGRFNSTSLLKGRVCFKENQNLSLFPIASLPSAGDSKLKFSYVARIMKCLEGMKDVEREELSLILKISAKQNRICKVYGLWSDLVDGHLYLVCQKLNGNLSKKLSEWGNGFIGVGGDGLSKDGIFSLAMIVMSICEDLIALHSEGMVVGCFGVSCFCFDELGSICFDLIEALVMGRKFCCTVADCISGCTSEKEKVEAISNYFSKNEVSISPELLLDLLQKEAITLESGHAKYPVSYASDVWSLACLLLRLLFGNALPQYALKMNEMEGFDFSASYISWVEKVSSFLEDKLGSDFLLLGRTLRKCLDINPGSRPHLNDLWTCIHDILLKPQFDILGSLEIATDMNSSCCLFLGELCQLPKETLQDHRQCELQEKADKDGKDKADKDLTEGLSTGMVEVKDLRGHLDCITGLTVGGAYLFSSSFDKTVHVWSLQDFSHLHTFRGHEHKIMALVYLDDEKPLCISGDSGGGIFIWGITSPFGQDPLKKWYEPKDWRFSGIHSLTVSRKLCLYTGSGDRSIRAWSLKDGTLICTMSGHRSVVSTLATCNDILYSGSWDGTIRLWSLNDHSLLTVLGEDLPGGLKPVLSIIAERDLLVAAQEHGCIKVWQNDVFMNSKTLHSGAIFAISMQGKCLYTGGWDKNVNIQEISGDEFQLDVKSIGSIPCSSVVTAILCWQGKLFVGCADKSIKLDACLRKLTVVSGDIFWDYGRQTLELVSNKWLPQSAAHLKITI